MLAKIASLSPDGNACLQIKVVPHQAWYSVERFNGLAQPFTKANWGRHFLPDPFPPLAKGG